VEQALACSSCEKIRSSALIFVRERKVYYERLLPHWHPPDTYLFITFSLFGSLPRIKRLHENPGKAFLQTDRYLDSAMTGPAWLKDPRVASAFLDVLRSAENEHRLCQIAAFVVMSNHVHLLLKPTLEEALLVNEQAKACSTFDGSF